MVFSILPRKAFTIECELTVEQFHDRLNKAFNIPGRPWASSAKIPPPTTSYIHIGEAYELEKTFYNYGGNKVAAIYGTGVVSRKNSLLSTTINYHMHNTGLSIVLLLLFPTGIIYLISSAILQKGPHNSGSTFLIIIMLIAPWIIRFFKVYEINLLHSRFVEALAAQT